MEMKQILEAFQTFTKATNWLYLLFPFIWPLDCLYPSLKDDHDEKIV